MAREEPSPHRRALLVAAAFALVPAVVAAVVVGLAAGWPFAPVGLVVAGGLALAWALRAGDRAALAGLEWVAADPVGHARLYNLLEGLCTAAGLRQPSVLVTASDALNLMAAGTSRERAVLGVTTGLLAELDRVELESVLAEGVYLIRHDETAPATTLAATFGIGRALAVRPERDRAADAGAVSLTRYPPALASALEKIGHKGSSLPGVPRRCFALWLAEPTGAEAAPGRRPPLAERIEAIREL